MKIGLSYDIKERTSKAEGLPEDAFEEYDSPETVEALAVAISSHGHTVLKLGGGSAFLKNVLEVKPDLVFNIAEGLGNYRSREAQVPSLLEMLDIPYSGSDPLTLSVCLEKPLTKQMVAACGVATPKWCVINDISELESFNWKEFPFPAFAKPAHEGSSKGIRSASRVDNARALKELIKQQMALYAQPMMVEEFIQGEEVTVGLLGNNPTRIIGIMHVIPRQKSPDFVYSLEVKRDWRNQVEYECPARFDESVLHKIQGSCLKAFKALGIRDLARMDFRISADGTPYFLEVNPLPGLNPQSGDYVIMGEAMGWNYKSLIGAVLNSAIERCGLGS
jgi:D-alanine-D-alanine ligase